MEDAAKHNSNCISESAEQGAEAASSTKNTSQPPYFPLGDLKKDYIRKFHTSRDTFFVSSILAGLFVYEKFRFTKTCLENHTHFTPNAWNWRSKTHAAHGLKIIKFLDLDIDLKSPCPESRREYLHFFSQKCRELTIKPFSILSTPGGYRIAFQLKYPVFTDNCQAKRLCEEALVLLKDVFQADPAPGLHSFTRLPQSHTSILMLESFNNIVLSYLLKRTIKPTRQKARAKAQPKENAGFWALRNNTAYTLGMICRAYGRDMSFARELILGLGDLDSERQLTDTLKSAFSGKKNATNSWCQNLCLGGSVAETARRFGILKRCTQEETREAQREAALQTNEKRKKETRRRIIEAIGAIISEGYTPTYRRLKAKGIRNEAIAANRDLLHVDPF